MAHTCHAVGCEVRVAPKYLMCPRHWRMVPVATQKRVWATYRPGQEITKDPTSEYMAAHYTAVAEVAELEGRLADAARMRGYAAEMAAETADGATS